MRRGTLPILLALLLLSSPLAAAGEKILEVISREVAVCSSPGGGELDARLYRGSLVASDGEKDGWYRVKLRNGAEGWVAGWLAREAPSWANLSAAFDKKMRVTSDNPAFGRVVVDSAEIRHTPYAGLTAKRDTTRFGVAPRGAVLKVTEVVFGWMRVELSPWEWGWVYSEALEPARAEEWALAWVFSDPIEVGKGWGRTSILTLDRPVPYRVGASAAPGAAHFLLYGVTCQALPPGSGARCGPLTGQLEETFFTDASPTGVSASMESRKFTFSVKTGMPAAPIVVLDPGHGAPEPPPVGFREGASSADGKLREKDLALDIAKRVRQLLESGGIRVEMTREADSAEMMDVYRRMDFADEKNADIFVSIHLNGDTDKSLSGAEVYWHEPLSRPLAEAIAAALSKKTSRPPGLSPYASFAVIRTTRRPSVLVEAAYLSNAKEAALLADSNFRQKIAEGIAAGIKEYISR